jgi:hypothetical protein
MTGLDGVIAATRRQLEEFDGTDEQFLASLMEQFHRAALEAPHGAGAKRMALSVYLLVRQQQLIEKLADDVAMRDYAIRFMSDLQ